MPEIREAGKLKPQGPAGGNMQLTVITPGTGSSGVYSEAVLKTAGEDKIWPKGTLCFADHPTESERFERPERSIRDVAGVLVEDAYWDGTALVAEVKTYDPWSTVLPQMADAIGVSIRAEGSYEEATGSGPPAIAKLTKGISVDFVTAAGRGGAIRQVYEAVRGDAPLTVVDDRPRRSSRTARQVAEALPGGMTANALRSALSAAIDDAYGETGDPDTGKGYAYAWVSDWTDTWVVFSISGQNDNSGLWQQGYSVTDSAVTLTGTKTAVMVQKTYVPAPAGAAVPGADGGLDYEESLTPAAACEAALLRELTEARTHKPQRRPAGSTPSTQTPGVSVPDIEESRLSQYQLAEARVPQLERELAESKAATATAERKTAIAESRVKARDFATKLIEGANPDLGPAAVTKIVIESTRDIPMTEDLQLDTAALTEAVNSEREAMESFLASVATQQGMGTVRGVGPAGGAGHALLTESDRAALEGGLFGSLS